LTEIIGARISSWREARLAAINPRTKRAYSAAAVNRPLDAVATGPGFSTKSAQDAKIDAERRVSP